MSYEVRYETLCVSPVIGPSVLRCILCVLQNNHDFICAGTFQMDRPLLFYFCTLKQRMVFMHASARRGCLHLIKNTVQFVKYQYDVKQLFSMWISVDQSCIFSIITSSSVSHDLQKLIIICKFAARETFYDYIDVENSRAAHIFVENDAFYFSGFTDE